MTERHPTDIAIAYAETAISAARNKILAAKARKEDRTGLAKLLEAISASEEVQANRMLMHLRGKAGAVDEETVKSLAEAKFQDFSRRYPRISHDLFQAGQKTPGEAFEQFGQVAENHFNLLENIPETGAYHVCGVCGYVAVDEAPDKCPVCGAVKKKFSEVR